MKWMDGFKRALLVFTCSLFALSVIFGGHSPAYAAQKESIVSQTPVTVAKEETVGNIVVIGNHAEILGAVTDTLVVINGDIHLASSSHVGLVILLGGQISQDPGAYADEVFALSFNTPLWNSVVAGAALAFSLWVLRLLISAGMVLTPTLFSIIFNPWLEAPIRDLKESLRQCIMIGILASISILAISAVFAITFIGLPVVALLLIAYGLLGLLGLSVVAASIGRIAFPSIPEKPFWKSTLIGSTFMMAWINVPLIGFLIFLIFWLTGTGAVMTWMWKGWQTQKQEKKKRLGLDE